MVERMIAKRERERCAKIALEVGYPKWDDDVPRQHRNAWEQCANRIATKIREAGDDGE
jgi:hypothetical protein